MRRMNSSWQGGGVRHSDAKLVPLGGGTMPNDENAARADSDKQDAVIIDAQLLRLE